MTEQASLVGALRRTEPDELEAGLNALIERRAWEKSPGELANEREAIWKASEEAHRAEHREANRHAWRSYYRRLSLAHGRLSEHFAGKASALDRGEGGS